MRSTFTGKFLWLVSPNPSCPYPLYPHAYTFPSLSNAIEKSSPAATETIFSNTPSPSGDFTCTFSYDEVLVPFPSWPYVLLPHDQTWPLLSTAKVCLCPNDISIILLIPVYVGTILFVVSPTPNCP